MKETTKYRKLSELNKLENNPRFIKTEDFEILCESIKNNPEYFEARPLILSDRTNKHNIVCYGMELTPEYCQITIDRFKKHYPDCQIKKL